MVPVPDSIDCNLLGLLAFRAELKPFGPDFNKLPELEIEKLLSDQKAVAQSKTDIARWNEQGISINSYWSEAYPDLLRHIADPPPILFIRGRNPERLSSVAGVAVVGSRRSNSHGDGLANRFGSELSGAEISVISGLAFGIDAAAHAGAMTAPADLPTIAVFGCGLDRIYPAAHEKLAARIVDSGGLLISQFEPGMPPLPHNFLNRNRVVAGLSRATIVVQATERSGALATARYAAESGREVFAVPGNLGDPRHVGTNRLIKQGAQLLTDIEEVLALFPERAQAIKVKESFSGSPTQMAILQRLADTQSIHLQELSDLGDGLETALLELELTGKIRRTFGNLVERVI